MEIHRRPANLALIGFMGTGKTSVGRHVAEQLGFEFLDTDELIQSHTGRTIADIFAKDGEPAFRELERQVVHELSTREKTLIATGGGLPTHAENLSALKSFAVVICLWASPEKIWERVRNQSHRPLLHDAEPQKKIRELLAAREPFYKQADVLINTDLRSVREAAQQVALQFKLATRPRR
jgi:shikimate kinase